MRRKIGGFCYTHTHTHTHIIRTVFNLVHLVDGADLPQIRVGVSLNTNVPDIEHCSQYATHTLKLL